MRKVVFKGEKVGEWRESSTEYRSESVCWWSEVFGEAHVGALCTCEHERTCRRRTRCRRGTRDASGQHVADAKREVATPFSFSFHLGFMCDCCGRPGLIN